MERIDYLGHPECLRLTNGDIDVIVATTFGPRILHYGFSGGPNMFGLFPDVQFETSMGIWRGVGGHRLWIAPESNPHSYAPDDRPVEVSIAGNLNLKITAPADAAGLEKSMAIGLLTKGSDVEVRHRIVNRNATPIEIAPWALTILDGGMSVLPLEPYRSHPDALHPTQPLVLWPFTDLSDPRLNLEARNIRITAEPLSDEPQKIGLANKREWAGYLKESTLFVKRYPYFEGETYPDYGVNTEVFVKGRFMELETLGPMKRLAPGEAVDHVERWRLVPNVGKDELAAHLESRTSTG
ncbi:hypothetical protein EON82_03835 [bacterium]|nr:MAG: hypothetical protein EON82_03835 [bacterium]